MEKQISTFKLAACATAGLVIGSISSASAAINPGVNEVSGGLRGSEQSADNAIEAILQNVLFFLGLVAVIMLLWWGFNILTAGGDDEKVSKGKKVVIQAAGGIALILLAYSIVTWIFNLFTGV